MDATRMIEDGLRRALDRTTAGDGPPLLGEAMRYAVFPGGARVRPRLCLAVARACGAPDPVAALGAATAIELMHCASLVHDDMPCFDDAMLRRGLPSVHAKFGEPLALLTGDALIVLAFETVATHAAPGRAGPLVALLGRSVGVPHGICAGQGWESEREVDTAAYHQAKTGALFIAACALGAAASDSDPAPWERLGEALGAAYQVADDLSDAVSTEADLGKPCGQDARNGRPSAADSLGIEGCVAQLHEHVAEAVAAIPDCEGAEALRGLIRGEATRIMPRQLVATAAE